jgi:hypothetical protein
LRVQIDIFVSLSFVWRFIGLFCLRSHSVFCTLFLWWIFGSVSLNWHPLKTSTCHRQVSSYRQRDQTIC